MLFDTHCHLNIADAFPDPHAAIAEAQAAGVARIVVVGIDIKSSRRAIEIAEGRDQVFATVGVHPNSSSEWAADTANEIKRLLAHPKAVAIGEIGLDYHWDLATPEQQRVALEAQLSLAEETGKPAVFHCRKAYTDLLNVLAHCDAHSWLLHCFSGTADDARAAIDLGCWFGIDGPITYPKASDLREIAKTLPRDRVVIETDSPYLTPAPHRGKPNRPSYLPLVNAALAGCLEMEEDECAAMTNANALRFFRIG